METKKATPCSVVSLQLSAVLPLILEFTMTSGQYSEFLIHNVLYIYREFHAEERPKSWNNSYEVSDHINSSENVLAYNYKEQQSMSSEFKENDSGQANRLEDQSLPIENELRGVMPPFPKEKKFTYKQLQSDIHDTNLYSEEEKKLTSSAFETMECSFKNIWEKEDKESGETILVDNDIAVGISIYLNESIRCEEIPTVCSSTIPDRPGFISPQLSESVLCYNKDKNNGERLTEFISPLKMTEQKKTCQGRTPLGYVQNKNILSARPKEVISGKVCDSTKHVLADHVPKPKRQECEGLITKSKSECQHFECLSDMDVDFSRYQCNSSSSNSCNFLFPPTKSLKLNLRQLNAAIGDGKIVVFPEKYADAKQTRLVDASNIKKTSDYAECEDISLSTSFLRKEKVGADIVLGNPLKYADECKSENIMVLPGTAYTNELSLNPNSSKAIALSPLNRIPHLQCDRECNSIGKTLYLVQDMSLNVTNIETMTNYNYSNRIMELDINSQSNLKIVKNRDTIYFNQDIESLNTSSVYLVQNHKSSSNNDMDINDVNSDSFILNLKEARATAMFSNCKRRIEGTPHRSFLEFVHLEKEVEQDNIIKNVQQDNKCFQKNSIKCMNNQEYVTKSSKDFLDNSLVVSPIWSSFSSKRLTANLTPHLPLPKRRHTLLFRDCAMDESIIFSDNLALNSLDSSCAGEFQLANDKYKEKEFAKNKDIMNPNEVKGLDYINGDASLKISYGNQTQQKNPTLLEDIQVGKNTLQSNLVSYQSEALKNSSSIPNKQNSMASFYFTKKYNESSVKDYSEYTIQEPRWAQPRISITKQPPGSPNIADTLIFEPENCKSFANVFEDDPITISDVSVHYLCQEKPLTLGKIGNFDQHECLADLSNTMVLKFITKFINLELENSALHISELSEIERPRQHHKAHLSVVETSLSKNADNGNQEVEMDLIVKHGHTATLHHSIESCSTIVGLGNSSIKSATLCRQCKRCQESISVAIESFALPSMPPFPSLPFDRLEKIRKHSGLGDVHEYWRRRSLEKKGNFYPACFEQRSDCINYTYINNFRDTIECFLKTLKQVNELDVFEPLQTDIFFTNLTWQLCKDLPNWILNCQMKEKGIVQFSNKKLVCCIIELLFEDKDQLGNEISIQGFTLKKGNVVSKYWKPIDYILYSNLDKNLNFNLKPFQIDNTKNIQIIEVLKLVNGVCNRLLKDILDLWQLICNVRATLIRQTNRVIVRKIVRDVDYDGDVHSPIVITTEFEIELRNIRALSFTDIISPPLYSLCEKVQFLPTGIDFLRVFLEDPTSYLR